MMFLYGFIVSEKSINTYGFVGPKMNMELYGSIGFGWPNPGSS